jgi:hypothetical protein
MGMKSGRIGRTLNFLITTSGVASLLFSTIPGYEKEGTDSARRERRHGKGPSLPNPRGERGEPEELS